MNSVRRIIRLFIPAIMQEIEQTLKESKLEVRNLIRMELDYVTKALLGVEKDFRSKIGVITVENADLLRMEYEKVREDFSERVGVLTESARGLETQLKETIDQTTEENIARVRTEYAEIEQRLLEVVKIIGSKNPKLEELTQKIQQYGLSVQALRKITK